VQNVDPNCAYDNTFGIIYSDSMLIAQGDANGTTTDCDRVRAFSTPPGWLSAIQIDGLTVEIQGSQVVISNGSIVVLSNYVISGTDKFGCAYDGVSHVLTDPTTPSGYYCRIP
jgi:hypothetical protein